MAIVENYTSFGGVHPETASITNVLASQGLRLSEAMVLGISGGLGAGYILWEFQQHRGQVQAKVLVLAFHNRWQYPMEFYQKLADRLGIKVTMPETGSKKSALQTLQDALDHDTPAIAWVDGASMPYLQMPEAMKGHLGHLVSICGRDGDVYFIDDLAAQPFGMDTESLSEARERIGSYKNRLLLIEDVPAAFDLEKAVLAGLQACVDHLSSDSESFSLPAIRKWARTMTDSKNKKGWLKVFTDRRGLFSTLISIFEGIELSGAPGGLRGLYGDFLLEAAPILGNDRLKTPAEHYHNLSAQWDLLAEEALPDSLSLCRDTKSLMRQRDQIYRQGGDAWMSTKSLTEQLREYRREGNLAFPLDDKGVLELFTTLQNRLNSIYQAELEALAALKTAMA